MSGCGIVSVPKFGGGIHTPNVYGGSNPSSPTQHPFAKRCGKLPGDHVIAPGRKEGFVALSDFDYQADINLGEWERSPGYFEGAPGNIPQHRQPKICPPCCEGAMRIIDSWKLSDWKFCPCCGRQLRAGA